MFRFKVLLLVMAFCRIAKNSKTCQKGQRVKAGGCAPCRDKYFQPEENHHTYCQVCTICEKNSGSYVSQNCTKETNTVCACRVNFVPRDTTDSSTCMCNPGYGLKDNECSKCEDGYFSKKRDSPCKKWRQCGLAGVKVNGTDTSDVVCNQEPNGVAGHVATNTTPEERLPFIVPMTPDTTPHKGDHSRGMLTTRAGSPPANVITQTTPANPSNRSYSVGVFITFTIVGLLVLIVLTWKLFSTSQIGTDCELAKHESLCQAVMEIGEKGCASVKLNPDEPSDPTGTDNDARHLTTNDAVFCTEAGERGFISCLINHV